MRICETFKSIQGEGKRIGAPTFFIRTVGCNLSCKWCDTKYAMDGGKEMTIDELLSLSKNENEICLTGGEPLLQKDAIELIHKLSSKGKTVVIETNGSIDISNIPDDKNIIISMDIKCPSSNMQDKMLFTNINLLKKKDQLKFVIADEIDYDYAVSICKKYNPDTEIIFTPVGGMDIKPLVEKIIHDNLNIRVLPQLHKMIWGEKKGV